MSAPAGILAAPTSAPAVGPRRPTASDDDSTFSAALTEAVESTEAVAETSPVEADRALTAVDPTLMLSAPHPSGDLGAEFVLSGDLRALLPATAEHPEVLPGSTAPIVIAAAVAPTPTAGGSIEGIAPQDGDRLAPTPPQAALLVGPGADVEADREGLYGASLGGTTSTLRQQPAPQAVVSALREEGQSDARDDSSASAPDQRRTTESASAGPAGSPTGSHAEIAVLDSTPTPPPAANAVRMEHSSAIPLTSPATLPTIGAVAPPSPVAAAGPATPLSAQIMPSIVAITSAGSGEHVVTVTVSPENLGPVTVRAHITAEGARFELSSPTEAGREALRALLPELRRDASGTGIDARLDLASGGRGRENHDADHGERPTPPPSPTVEARRHQPTVVARTGAVSTSTTIDITI